MNAPKFNVRVEYHYSDSEEEESIDGDDECSDHKHEHCSKHKHLFSGELEYEDDVFNTMGYYYGQCAYCILDGESWNEEWDSFDEIAGRTMELTYLGYYDMNKYGRNYLDECIKEKTDNEHIAFRNMYRFGIQLAEKGVDLGHELWDITGNRIYGNQFNGPIISRDITNDNNPWKKTKNKCGSRSPRYPVPPHMT
jgi:hypothetical protein